MKRMLGFRKISLLSACLAIIAVILLVSSDTLPALSQDPSGLITIESNDPIVGQTGTWTSQNAAEASGGSYLYSNGNEDDALTLDFYGSTLEITYVSHPSFGTFAIEVDNTILRTVSATSEETTFGQLAVIDYLEDEAHSLRVFAVEGIVAIDAFTTQLPPPAPNEAQAEAGVPEALTCNPDTFPVRASIGDGDVDTNGKSVQVSMSGDGRYVSFSSEASNLLETVDGNGLSDIFVLDRLLCVMTRVNVSSAGVEATGGHSYNPSISQYGRYVAFESNATNLLGAGNDTNSATDVFVHDRVTGTTTRVSVSTAGTQTIGGNSTKPDISNDGQKVAFQSDATNLVGGDTNSATDIFVRDIGANTTTRVSLTNSSTQSLGGNSTNAAISGNGQFVAFESAATNLLGASDTNGRIDIFVRELSGTTTRVSVVTGGAQIGDEDSLKPDISNDGRYVVFETLSEDIVPTFTNEFFDIYVHDRNTTTTTRVSLAFDNTEGDDDSNGASISGNGKYVAFHSGTSLFDVGDTGGIDIFVKELATGAIMRASLLNDGSEPTNGTMASLFSSISDSGRNVAFETLADLTSDTSDNNSVEDIYVADVPLQLAPSDLIATSLSDEEIALHWNDNTSDETNFELQRSFSSDSGFATFQTISANFRDWTDNGLTCETTYYYRVRALRPGGDTDYSNVSTARTQLCPMSPPSNFQITATGQSNVDLSWVDESGTETEFRVDYKIGAGAWNDPEFPIATVEPNVVSFRLSGLNCSEDYTFRVRAYRASDGNLTIPSNEDSTTTLICTEPGETSLIAPEGPSAIGVPSFRFTEPRLVTHVNIQVRDAANVNILRNEWYELFTQAPCSGGVCSVTDPAKLSFGEGEYNWCILTYDVPSSTVYGGVFNVCFTGTKQFSVVPPKPTSPIDIEVNSFVDTVFVWDESPGITYYKLELITNSGVTIINEWFEAAPICAAASCTVTIPNRLPGNGLYWWRIRVWNTNGYGPYSDWVTFTVNVAAPGEPQGLTVQKNVSGVPTAFEWTKDGNVSWYRVYASGPGGIWINKWSEADTICGVTTCSFSTSLPFVDGDYKWWVQAYSPTGLTAWSLLSGTPLNISITDPAIPTTLAITANPVGYPPTELSWDDDDNTTWFNVFIQDQYDQRWLNAWYEKGNSAVSCNGSTCTLPVNIAFLDRDYDWWVRGHGPGGTSPYSGEDNFTVAVGTPDIPTGLDETFSNGLPIDLLWTNDDKVTWYNIVIKDQYDSVWYNTWYERGNSVMTCGGFCQVPVSSIAFLDRTYYWWVQAYGPGGSNIWSDWKSFVVGVGAPNEPTGLQTTVGLESVRFQWDDDNKATWFNVFVRDQYQRTWVNKWYQKGNSAMTCSGTCDVTIDLAFHELDYEFWLQAYGPGSGTWTTTSHDFTITYIDGLQPDGLAETIDIATGMPSALTWNSDQNVTWYQVYVQATSGGVWLNKWYEASTICDLTTCTASVDTIPFIVGTNEWYVNAYAPGGGGGWSAKRTFTIDTVTLAAPALQSPAVDAFFSTTNVTFQWASVGQADWYVLEIKGSNGQVYTTLWFRASVCNAGICTGSSVLSSELLINATWRVRGYRNVGGIYGNWSVSRTISILS